MRPRRRKSSCPRGQSGARDRPRYGSLSPMKTSERVLLAVTVVLVDVAIFFVPVAAVVAAYVILARPPWFRRWVDELYRA